MREERVTSQVEWKCRTGIDSQQSLATRAKESTPVPARLSPVERIRAEIHELFASG
jgi:hypothetical protein